MNDPIKKPLTSKQVAALLKDGRLSVVVAVEFGRLIETGSVDSLNDLCDELILQCGSLSDISYRVVGHVRGEEDEGFIAGKVLIEVNAETVDLTGDYVNDEESDDE